MHRKTILMLSVWIISLALVPVIGVTPVAASETLDDLVDVHQPEGVTYFSGGFGKDERAVLQPLARAYTMKLIFAHTNGELLGQINLVIKNQRGDRWLETVSPGPWFFAKLPSGSYSVEASFEGRRIVKRAKVTAGRQRSLSFYWKK